MTSPTPMLCFKGLHASVSQVILLFSHQHNQGSHPPLSKNVLQAIAQGGRKWENEGMREEERAVGVLLFKNVSFFGFSY
jgi:hypothetical protein